MPGAQPSRGRGGRRLLRLQPQFAALTPARRPLGPTECHVQASPTLRLPGPVPAGLRCPKSDTGARPRWPRKSQSHSTFPDRPATAQQGRPAPWAPQPATAGAGSADVREPQPESRSLTAIEKRGFLTCPQGPSGVAGPWLPAGSDWQREEGGPGLCAGRVLALARPRAVATGRLPVTCGPTRIWEVTDSREELPQWPGLPRCCLRGGAGGPV